MQNTLYIGTSISDTLSVRKSPTDSSALIDGVVVNKNDRFYISEMCVDGKRMWGKTDVGWVCLRNGKTKYVDYHPYTPPIQMRQNRKSSIDSVDVTNEILPRTTSLDVRDAEQSGSGGGATFQPAAQEEFQAVFDTLMKASMASLVGDGKLKKSMRLFGLPYQFRPEIDPRIPELSEKVGRQYAENIVAPAPIVTIIPGKPKYLPGSKNKSGLSHAFMSLANGSFAPLQALLGNENEVVRYYDFTGDYYDYMQRVNIMCRTAASFMELTDELDGTPLQSYDWKNYRWNAEDYQASVGGSFVQTGANVVKGVVNTVAAYGSGVASVFKSLFDGLKGGKSKGHEIKYDTDTKTESEEDGALLEDLTRTANFVQFYVDPDSGVSESASNSVTDSKIASFADNASDMLKELSFVTSSGGGSVAEFQEFMDKSANALSDAVSGMGNNGITSFISRFLDVSSNVMKGENIIVPQIYNRSDYEKSYNITVHLKAPYGNKFSYFLEVLVPLFHLLALALPKQTTANTYGAPFLVKVFCSGVFTCNLGIVSSITINKSVSPESWTNDGYPSEIDVQLNITDLYSDLTTSPQQNPLLFLANTSLIEYIAMTCGLDLLQPQLQTRVNYTINAIKNAFGDIPSNVVTYIQGQMNEAISGWFTITGR